MCFGLTHSLKPFEFRDTVYVMTGISLIFLKESHTVVSMKSGMKVTLTAKRCLSSSEQCLHSSKGLSGGIVTRWCLSACIKIIHNLALLSWKLLKSVGQWEVDNEFLIFIFTCAHCSLHLLNSLLPNMMFSLLDRSSSPSHLIRGDCVSVCALLSCP